MLASFLLLALAAVSANAHSAMQQIFIDGKAQGAWTGVRVPKTNTAVTDVTSNNVICNIPRTPLPTKAFEVKGGSKIGMEWRHEINKALSSDVISKSHRGPIQVYLAKVNDATQSDVTGLKWFKIAEQGYDAKTNTWATDDLINNKGVFDVTIPSCIEAGDYIMRTDLTALHNADKASGAQLYIGCTGLKISGTDGSATPSTVSFPGAYKPNDPGLKFNIYKKFSSYPIPGPSTFSCNGSSQASSNADSGSTTTTTTKAASTTKASTKTKSTTTKTKTVTSTVTADSLAKVASATSTKCRAKRGHA